MISVASASFSRRSTTPRSAWYPGVTAPCAMCSRARLRSVSMSERNAPAISLVALGRLVDRGRGAAGSRRALRVALGVGGLLRLAFHLVALDARLLHARILGFALLVVAALLRDFVLRLGLGFGHLLLRLDVVLGVLGVELGL